MVEQDSRAADRYGKGGKLIGHVQKLEAPIAPQVGGVDLVQRQCPLQIVLRSVPIRLGTQDEIVDTCKGFLPCRNESDLKLIVPLRESCSSDLVQITVPAASIGPGPHANSADLFHRPLGADVLWGNKEDYAADEAKRVPQHEPLHLAVVAATPLGSGQKCPADLDLASFLVVAVEARRPNHLLSVGINGDQGTAGR